MLLMWCGILCIHASIENIHVHTTFTFLPLSFLDVCSSSSSSFSSSLSLSPRAAKMFLLCKRITRYKTFSLTSQSQGRSYGGGVPIDKSLGALIFYLMDNFAYLVPFGQFVKCKNYLLTLPEILAADTLLWGLLLYLYFTMFWELQNPSPLGYGEEKRYL